MLVAQNSLGPVCPVPLTVRGSIDAANLVFSLDGDHRVRVAGGGDETRVTRALTEEDMDAVVFVRNDGAREFGDDRAGLTTRLFSLVTVVELAELGGKAYMDFEVNDGAVQLIDGYPVDRDAQAREKWVIPHALRESWTTRDGAPLTVRGLVALVMAQFRIKERRGDVRTRFSRYSDKAFLSPRDGRQLAERVAQSGPTFSLESSGGLIEGMFCGPTYLIV